MSFATRFTRLMLSLSIRRKIILVVVATSLLVLSIILSLFLYYSTVKWKERHAEELFILAEILGDRSSSYLVYKDRQAMADSLSSLRIQPSITYACVYNESKELFASYQRVGEAVVCPGYPPVGAEFKDNAINIHKEIYAGNTELIGSILISSDLSSIREFRLHYRILSILFVALGCLFAYLLSLQFHQFVTRPIKRLAKAATDVASSHNYNRRVPITSLDELGGLVTAFNTMLNEIQAQDQEIKEVNSGLEARVQRRTKALEEAKIAAEAASKAKSAFLANMSHELRTPMHAILSYSEFGLEEIEDADKEELQRYFQRIHTSGDRLLGLLDNLLNLSKLQSDLMDFTFRENNVAECITRAVSDIKEEADEKSITIKTDLKDEALPANCDAEKIILVINQLLSNAIKFSEKETTITVEGRKDSKGNVVVSVADQGIGVPEADRIHIFDAFAEGSQTQSGAGGKGLGLAICHGIITKHHGTIECSDNKDSGAVFSFAIPQKPKHDANQG